MSFALKVKKYIKTLVVLLEKTLPEKTFNAFYNFMFPQYKECIRSLYKIKTIKYKLSGDIKNITMHEKICQIMPYTLVGIGGLEATYKLAKEINEKKVEGNFVELGVARGGCAALMGGVAFEDKLSTRQLWLFDSFEGLPEPTSDDFIRNDDQGTGNHVRPLPAGSCLGTLEEVQSLMFNKFNFPEDRILLVKGWFQDTLPAKKKDVGKIAILRIDGDWYESTKCCLENLYDQVVPNGAVIIDDYHSCFGCKKAVDEFIANRNLSLNINFDGRGGCYFMKPNCL